MITGAHTIIYSSDPDATRAFCRDILGFPAVDGDTIYQFEDGGYRSSVYVEDLNMWLPSAPAPIPGEGFWLLTTESRPWTLSVPMP